MNDKYRNRLMKRYIIIFMLMLCHIGFAVQDNAQVDSVNTLNTFNNKGHKSLEAFYDDGISKIFENNDGNLFFLIGLCVVISGIVLAFIMNARHVNNTVNSKLKLRENKEREKLNKILEAFLSERKTTETQAQVEEKAAYISELLLMARKEKDYDNAINYCNQAISLAPTYIAYFYKGNINCYFNRYDEALIDLSESIRLDPNNEQAYNDRGVVNSKLAKHKDAINDYTQVISLDPNNAKAYSNRGIANVDIGRYEDAIFDYNQAIRLAPYDSEIYFNRAFAYAKLGKYEYTILNCTQAINLNPNNSKAYNNRGIAKSELGREEEAILDYNEAIYLDPYDSFAYSNRSDSKIKLGDNIGAILDCSKAIELDPTDFCAYSNRGEAYYNLEEYELALKDLDKADSFGIELLDIFKFRVLTLRVLAKKEIDEAKKAEYLNRADVDEKKAKDLADKPKNI